MSERITIAPRQKVPRVNTRIKNSTKPGFVTGEPQFYRCEHCHRLLINENYIGENQSSDEMGIRCCHAWMTKLIAHAASDDQAIEHQVSMVISGGFDANVITIQVGEPAHPMQADHALQWIYLHTFQGGQIKFIPPSKTPATDQSKVENKTVAIFALSDSDAYVYCDRRVCKGNQCKFNCKRGFTAYAYCNLHGLWKTTM